MDGWVGVGVVYGGSGGQGGGQCDGRGGGQLGKIHFMDLLSVDHRLGGVHSVEFFLDCAVSRALDRSLDAVVQVGVGAGLAGKVDQDALHAARLSVLPGRGSGTHSLPYTCLCPGPSGPARPTPDPSIR